MSVKCQGLGTPGIFHSYYHTIKTIPYLLLHVSIYIVYFAIFLQNHSFFALFKKIVALGYLIQQKYHNDIRNMLP